MLTFKAYLRKEFIESIRQYKYLLLAFGIIIFALADPIMLKLLPEILKKQLPGDISSLFVITQKTAAQNYIKDLNQIGLLFVAFVFSGTLCEEIYSEKLVFPYSKGANPASIVAAKILNYSLAVITFTIIGFLINYYYINVLFEKDPLKLVDLFPSIILVIIFFFFNITLTIFFSSIFKKGLTGGIIVLAVNIITGSLVGIKSIAKFIPYKLISSAYLFNLKGDLVTIIFTLFLSVILILITIIRMNKIEVV